MNERIRELAEKAGLDMWINGNDEVELSENQKKFAELIVRECMMLVEGFESTQEVALDEYVDYEASVVLKEHFGVEE